MLIEEINEMHKRLIVRNKELSKYLEDLAEETTQARRELQKVDLLLEGLKPALKYNKAIRYLDKQAHKKRFLTPMI